MNPIVNGEVSILRPEVGLQDAFSRLVRLHRRSMLRIAMSYVRSRAVAEEVLQDTWLAASNGLTSFEGRSSLKTWMFAILVNCARSHGVRESRTMPFSSLESWPGCESSGKSSEDLLLDKEVLAAVAEAIGALSAAQRQVIVMRDIEGSSSAETRAALGLTKANQRVLLHRARSKVRAALERRFAH